MKTLINGPLVSARSHALPFRVIFEEAYRCRPERLRLAVASVLLPQKDPKAIPAEEADKALLDVLEAHDKAYLDLEENAEKIAKGDTDAPKEVERLLTECAKQDCPLKNILHASKATALCLSGGGIRSASFALGILEGLARFSCLPVENGLFGKLDYLSTVSGGGYIGSWLMAWVYRRRASAGSPDCKASYAEVISALAGKTNVTASVPEPPPIRHLRSYTSFLAPMLGLTLDTFTLAAIVLRNILVNWVMLLPLLFAIAALGQISGYLLISVREYFEYLRLMRTGPTPELLQLIIASVFAFAAIAATFALPSHDETDSSGKWRVIAIWVFLLAVSIGSWLVCAFPSFRWDIATGASLNWKEINDLFLVILILYGMLAGSIWISYNKRIKEVVNEISQNEPKKITKDEMRKAAKDEAERGTKDQTSLGFSRRRETVFLLVIIATVVTSYLMSVLIYVVRDMAIPFLVHHEIQWTWFKNNVDHQSLFATFSVPLVISCLLVVTSLFCAVLGLFELEEDREWWVRAGGVLLAFTLAWVVVNSITFFGPPIIHSLKIAALGLLTAFGVSWLGFSSATSSGTGAVKISQLSGIGKFLQKHNLLLPILSGAAILLIELGVVTLFGNLSRSLINHWPNALNWGWAKALCAHGWRNQLGAAAVLFLAFLILAVITNLSINVNVFSLHGMYRMRLMRTFLGASNIARQPDPFTNFDPRDTPREIDLPSEPGIPLHVICTTLNLVGTRNPAWRQRRAESFTFSPVSAGGWQVGYVPAEKYGGVRGVSLATALSVSGAAFNPNMGYQSSPLLGFLMTFFNLRLGYWLPNPKWCAMKPRRLRKAARFLSKPGPSFALGPLIEEALGQTNDTNRWIELTDGGHFDNLGLYEMVMRRCKLIIVSDAGADPKCHFEDLGNAIRKIQIDLGVPIVFPGGIKMVAGLSTENEYCAVARIEYGWTDAPGPGQNASDLDGYLIYIKPGLNGTEDMDIQQYSRVHGTFPHETTANQFFDEPQFESYRKLGYHVLRTISETSKPAASVDGTITDLFERAKAYSGYPITP